MSIIVYVNFLNAYVVFFESQLKRANVYINSMNKIK